jgi:hypothetical protein
LLAPLFAGLSITLSTAVSALITVGALDTPGQAYDVEVVGDLAYVADGGAGLRVIDIFDPAAPIELGALDTPGIALDVEVVGDLAYLAAGVSGLRILDVSNPAALVELGALDTPSVALDVEVIGDMAYVVDMDYGLRVVQVSNPRPCPSISLASTRRALRTTSRWSATSPTWPIGTMDCAPSTSPFPPSRSSSAPS